MIIVGIVLITAVLEIHSRATSNTFEHPPVVVIKCGSVQGITEHFGKSFSIGNAADRETKMEITAKGEIF